MGYDVVVVGAGTAGCVLAARLSEEPGRSVCLLEAGPDYGPLTAGDWPAELLDPRRLVFTHDWGVGGEDGRSLGARVIGGSSAHNACIAVLGSPADYDEWGAEWSWRQLGPCLERALDTLGTRPANTDRPTAFHEAFVAGAVGCGHNLLDDPNDPAQATGVAWCPANVTDGMRWNAALAYLDPARGRPNLTVRGSALVDRVVISGGRATAVVTADGNRVEAGCVVLAAGAYLSPAVLLRSGIGPAADLGGLGIDVVADLPVGSTLLDHHGTGVGWAASEALVDAAARYEAEHGPPFEPGVVVKAASTSCPEGSWDLHLLPWLACTPGDPRAVEPTVAVFHMKPLSSGRVQLRSTAPDELPHVERGLLASPADLDVIVEGVELSRAIAASDPVRSLLGPETRPGMTDVEQYVRETARNYFHPAGTCPIGPVVDTRGHVHGVDGLLVADASIMPTIPRANTNVTAAAIGERVAELFAPSP